MDKQTTTGHITALVTIMIWETTFISAKMLLADFTPREILFFRFLLCLCYLELCGRVLGTLKTSVYINIVPVITATSSVIMLKEEITWIAAIGIVLTLIGLFLSESKLKFRKRGK